jgi:hypothetical protein
MQTFWKERTAYLRKPLLPDSIRKGTMTVVTGMAATITALNYFWFYKMCRGAIKVFSRPPSRQLSSSAFASTLPQNAAASQGTSTKNGSGGSAAKDDSQKGAVWTGGQGALSTSDGYESTERHEVVEIPAEEALAHEAT